ncbi:MAG TPA: DUF92 domain-containing protein [Bacteroidota bacterium]|nr:DUF92 domain-containing protein [Bacteroidota bacterium]
MLSLCIGIVAGVVAGFGAYRLRWLSLSGSVFAGILAAVLIICGGVEWIVPMIAFFIPSSMLSVIFERKKASVTLAFEKGSRRDALQVLVNGGVGGVLVFIWFVTRQDELFLMYLGGLTAVAADTWATESGILWGRSPVRLVSFERVEPGTSGAVSAVGTLGGLAGAICISLSGLAWIPNPKMIAVLAAVLAGMTGCMIDSVLGAVVQRRYRCMKCGRLIERPVHCDANAEWIGGLRWFNNDLVNLACYLGGMISVLGWYRVI